MTTMSEPGIVRRLMVATIVDVKFLRGLRALWRDDLVGSTWRWLAGRCFNYLDRYGEAPGRNIEALWETEVLDPEVRGDLEEILAGLSEEWESGETPLNADLLLQAAADHFARELYLTKAAELEGAAEAGDLARAREIADKELKPPTLEQVPLLNPSDCPEHWREAFSEEARPLVRLGGALQELVGVQVVRDSFVAFLGKEKVGKTWMLQGIAFAAVRAGSRVLFCQCGDLSMGQQLRRFGIQLTGRSDKPRYNVPLLSPVPDCYHAQSGECQRAERVGAGAVIRDGSKRPYPELEPFEGQNGYEPCAWRCPEFRGSSWWEEVPPESDLGWEEAYGAYRRWDRACGGRLRIERFPNRRATLAAIDDGVRRTWETQGWKPDVVIADYLDIFDREPGSPREFRHQEDARWSAARRFAEEWQCAFITVTQATRDTYRRRLLSEGDSSEDKRKAAHVTAYFGLNRDAHDKRRRWLRVNPLFIREDDFDVHDQVTVLQLLQRGRPNLASFWYRKGRDEE